MQHLIDKLSTFKSDLVDAKWLELQAQMSEAFKIVTTKAEFTGNLTSGAPIVAVVECADARRYLDHFRNLVKEVDLHESPAELHLQLSPQEPGKDPTCRVMLAVVVPLEHVGDIRLLCDVLLPPEERMPMTISCKLTDCSRFSYLADYMLNAPSKP